MFACWELYSWLYLQVPKFLPLNISIYTVFVFFPLAHNLYCICCFLLWHTMPLRPHLLLPKHLQRNFAKPIYFQSIYFLWIQMLIVLFLLFHVTKSTHCLPYSLFAFRTSYSNPYFPDHLKSLHHSLPRSIVHTCMRANLDGGDQWLLYCQCQKEPLSSFRLL